MGAGRVLCDDVLRRRMRTCQWRIQDLEKGGTMFIK